METILYMATSLDGYISRQDDSEDFTLINEVGESVKIAKDKCAQALKIVRVSRNNSHVNLEHVSN